MTRIIGVGSAFNDDDIGWRCLYKLETKLQLYASDIEVAYCANPATQLIHLLQPETLTILVDALQTQHAAGEVCEIKVADLHDDQALSSHHISVGSILQLASNLDRLPEDLFILGLGTSSNHRLSEQQVEQLQRQLLEKILSIVSNNHYH